MTVSIMLVENSPIIRQGLVCTLSSREEVRVVAEVSTGFEAVNKVKDVSPDLILINRWLPGIDGIGTTRLLTTRGCEAKVIIFSLSWEDTEDEIFEAIKAGASGYIGRNVDVDHLVRYVKRVAEGGAALDEESTAKLLKGIAFGLKEHSAMDPVAVLSKREKEILELVCEGAPNKSIATSLIISENTVRSHIRNIMSKLDVSNRTELASVALRYGFSSGSSRWSRQSGNGSNDEQMWRRMAYGSSKSQNGQESSGHGRRPEMPEAVLFQHLRQANAHADTR